MADRDYPKLPSIQEAETSKVDSATLREMIAKTIFSVSLDETRQHLSGVLFESDGTTARMVSTDGHRLSKVGRPMLGGPKLPAGVLIPRKGVAELRRAIETREAPCAIGVHQGNFVLKADDVGISVELIDGQFLPRPGHPGTTSAPSAVTPGFLDAAHAVALMSSDKTSACVWRSRREGMSRATTRTWARRKKRSTWPRAPADRFNARYFIDLLTEIETPEVRVELSGELDPAVVRPADGGDYVCVVMPMRL
jgi:DNA polymerase-3 subunit beta